MRHYSEQRSWVWQNNYRGDRLPVPKSDLIIDLQGFLPPSARFDKQITHQPDYAYNLGDKGNSQY
jgi:hypothetical protein